MSFNSGGWLQPNVFMTIEFNRFKIIEKRKGYDPFAGILKTPYGEITDEEIANDTSDNFKFQNVTWFEEPRKESYEDYSNIRSPHALEFSGPGYKARLGR